MTTKRNGRHVRNELARRGYAPDPHRPAAAPTGSGGITRRHFLGSAAGGSLALGIPTLLAACGGGEDAAQPETERRTLFFNFAHEDHDATEHFLVFGGKHRPLVKVKDAPGVLARERAGNAFLRSVPDDQITHHIDDFEMPASIAVMVYVTSKVDHAAGTWEMSSIVQIIPSSGATTALARAQALGLLPRSLKRQRYGQPAAQTVADLVDESALLDSSDHARTLVAMLPDLLSADPGSAQHINTSHIQQQQSQLRFLAATIESLGPAKPQQQADKANAQGWATLVPFNDEADHPILNSIGLRAYMPDWNTDVERNVTSVMRTVTSSVKNDETLGINMTGLGPAAPGDRSSAGKLWNRTDGQASVERSLADPPSALAGWTLNGASTIPGLYFNGVTVGPADAKGAVPVTLPKILNLFLRFLGAWATFRDVNGNIIAIKDLPAGTIPGTDLARDGLNKDQTAFLGLVPPPYTVAGIPVGPGWLSPLILVPPSVSSIEYQFAGLGFNGSWHDPSGIIPIGGTLTGLVNFAIPLLFMAAGVSNLEQGIRDVLPFLSAIVGELVAYIAPSFDWSAAPDALQVVALFGRLVLAIVNGFYGKGVTLLVAALVKYLAVAEIVDALPIVGLVARAVAAVIGEIVLAETLIEVALSAPISGVTLVGTHELKVTVTGDPNHAGNLPTSPPGYGPLHYKVTYQFDSGAIHTMDAVPLPDPLPDQKKLPIRLVVPRGGKVCVSIALYANKTGAPDGQREFCAAKGTTGPQDNTIDNLPDIVLEEIKIPIVAGTRYIHTSKTQLDSQGRHYWLADPSGANAPPYIAPGEGQQNGQLGALRSITVRQDTLAHPGYLGYSWRAFSAGLLDCTSGQTGQLDQAANLSTDLGRGGLNAQNGYAMSPCGLEGGGTSGLTVAYSLLNEDGRNIYFDSTTRHVRPISLASPPTFLPPAPGSPSSFGQLNFDSTRLLL
ncbi:MAG: hypothetical protein M3Y32_03940, partial [Pseudomonadota bacterium]|nr:hypothetical protein [Pseudomonadota bacterium]